MAFVVAWRGAHIIQMGFFVFFDVSLFRLFAFLRQPALAFMLLFRFIMMSRSIVDGHRIVFAFLFRRPESFFFVVPVFVVSNSKSRAIVSVRAAFVQRPTRVFFDIVGKPGIVGRRVHRADWSEERTGRVCWFVGNEARKIKESATQSTQPIMRRRSSHWLAQIRDSNERKKRPGHERERDKDGGLRSSFDLKPSAVIRSRRLLGRVGLCKGHNRAIS